MESSTSIDNPSGQIKDFNETHFFVEPIFSPSDKVETVPNEIINDPSESAYPVKQLNHEANFKPLSIGWGNLNVHSKPSTKLAALLGNPKESVHIIKNVSGYLEPGNLLAILGSSGAGKTTLLNVLTGQNLKNVTVDGQVLLNNEPTTIERLSMYSSYVQQDDLFFGYLTVKEHLKFQLKLRSPVDLTGSQVDEKIDQLIERLGLTKVADSRINCEQTGQRLSGGERKRLSVATEILTDPSILFCDEPTSGLDSFMAQSVVSVLKSLTLEHRTVICTIHQPSSEIFKLFDKIMLIAEGRLAFYGTAGQSIEFFSSNDLHCPSNYNPPDFFIQQLSIIPGDEDRCRSKVNMICDNYEKTNHFQYLKKQIEPDKQSISNGMPQLTDQSKYLSPSPHKRGIWTQFSYLLWRSMVINLRDPMLTASRITSTLFSAFLVSLVYWQQNLDQEGVMNINGAIFLLIVNANFSSIFIVINAFCQETPIFLREHAAGLYRVSVYYLARTLSDQPYFIILPILMWTTSYYAVGLYNDLATFMIGNGVSILIVNAASGFGYFVSTISTSVTMGLELAPPLMSPLILLGGTFLNNSTIPGWLTWIKYFSWIYYANEILTINQWRDVTSIDCDYDIPIANQMLTKIPQKSNGTVPSGQGCLVNGPQVIASVGFDKKNLHFDYWMLVVVIVLFRVLAYLSLLVRSKLRR